MGKIVQSAADLDSCALCIKYLLFALNFLYFAAGVSMLGVSIWIYIERNFISVILGTDLLTVAVVMLIITASAIILISFFGCCGSIMENKSMILIYFLILLVIFLGMVVGGILAVVFRSEIGEEVRGRMRSTLQQEYGVKLDNDHNVWITNAWDRSQEFLRCCAVEEQGWGAYKASEWYKEQPGVAEGNKPYVPESCCEVKHDYDTEEEKYIDLSKCQTWELGPPSRQSGDRNEALHYRGCYMASVDFAGEHSGYIIGLGIGIGISVILGLIFSIVLYVQIARS